MKKDKNKFKQKLNDKYKKKQTLQLLEQTQTIKTKTTNDSNVTLTVILEDRGEGVMMLRRWMQVTLTAITTIYKFTTTATIICNSSHKLNPCVINNLKEIKTEEENDVDIMMIMMMMIRLMRQQKKQIRLSTGE